MKNRTSHESPEQLIQNLRELITEAEKTIAASAAEQVEGRLADLRERLDSAKEKISDAYNGARQKVTDGARQADDTIRSHPYESIAIAVGVGVLLGALLRRKS